VGNHGNKSPGVFEWSGEQQISGLPAIVLFINGLTPKPQFNYWFCSQDEEPLFGSNMISKALNWKNLATGKTVTAG
jgi:hypothetical protein